MRTSLDTNILSTILLNQHPVRQVVNGLTEAKREGATVVSPFTYSELLAHPNVTQKFIVEFLSESDIKVDYNLSEALWTLAGIRFAAYAVRRRSSAGTTPRRILADFLIGAHALLQTDRLMTLDAAFYERNFPELRLYPIV